MLCYVRPTTLIDRFYVDIILLYIYIFYASRLAFGDDGKYVYNTRLAWLMWTMYETPR